MTGACNRDLARRSARLADALLERLDDAERDEVDPDQLSALLFTFDHLATRIRHDTQSLLVLAGADTARDHAAPVPLLDVLRAAQSRIQAYQRVEYGRVDDDVSVEPAAVDGVVHLLAELLDNAARHAGADRPVGSVEARRTGDGAVIHVADRGPGVDLARRSRRSPRRPGPVRPAAGADRHRPARRPARARRDPPAGAAGPGTGSWPPCGCRPPWAGQAAVAPMTPVAARPLPPRLLERSPALPGAEPMDIPHPRKDAGHLPVVPAGVAADGPTVEARAFDEGPPRRTVDPSSHAVSPLLLPLLLRSCRTRRRRRTAVDLPARDLPFDAVAVPVNQEGHATS